MKIDSINKRPIANSVVNPGSPPSRLFLGQTLFRAMDENQILPEALGREEKPGDLFLTSTIKI